MKQIQLQALDRVHAAILCPDGAATTILLNCMAGIGGRFVCAEVIQQRVEKKIALVGGQPQAPDFAMAMLRMFDVPKKRFEEWTNVPYDPLRVYHMAEFLERRVPVLTEERKS